MSVALAARAAVAARAAHRAPRLGMRRAAGSHRPAAAGGASGAAQLATGKFGEELYADITWPEEFPFGPADLKRMDESSDFDFYAQPRFCTHIDDFAIGALTRWYGEMLPRGDDVAVLDMCSSWISHYPEDYSAERVVGLGMNEEELKRNKQLTEFVVKDLNEDPTLPFEDNSFDFVTNAVSVDYLCRPQEVFAEIGRVLKPGGMAACSFSNRCFPTKVIGIWNQTTDADHCLIVGSYFRFEPKLSDPMADDISPNPGASDPMYVIYGRKLESKDM
eukprot:PRCOL_00001733-RA